MGNSLAFGERDKYVKFEAGLGAALLGITIIGFAVVFFIYCCCCHNGRLNCKNRTSTEQPNRKTRTKNQCERCSHFFTSTKYFHRILGIAFSSISELYVRSEDNAETEDSKIKPVLIISETKIPTGCIELSTYMYFTYILLMCSLWFIAIAVEFSIYRKTGTCNDINVDVQSFSCFDVDDNFAQIDCEETSDIDTRRVICYLYSPSIAGFGVAFSAANFISVIGDIAFKAITKVTNLSTFCALLLRILGICAVVASLALFLGLTQSATRSPVVKGDYFTYGLLPMRIIYLILLCLTFMGMLLIPPWQRYPTSEYNKKYRHLGYVDVEKAKNSEGEPPPNGKAPQEQEDKESGDTHIALKVLNGQKQAAENSKLRENNGNSEHNGNLSEEAV